MILISKWHQSPRSETPWWWTVKYAVVSSLYVVKGSAHIIILLNVKVHRSNYAKAYLELGRKSPCWIVKFYIQSIKMFLKCILIRSFRESLRTIAPSFNKRVQIRGFFFLAQPIGRDPESLVIQNVSHRRMFHVKGLGSLFGLAFSCLLCPCWEDELCETVDFWRFFILDINMICIVLGSKSHAEVILRYLEEAELSTGQRLVMH